MKLNYRSLPRLNGSAAIRIILALAATAWGTTALAQSQGQTPPTEHQAQNVSTNAAPAAQDKRERDKAADGTIVEGELLVQFKASATEAEIDDAKTKGKLRVRKQIRTNAMKAKGHRGVTQARTDLPVEEAIAELNNHPAVEYAEPNWVYTHQAVSNDPYYTAGYLWGLCGDATSPSTPWGAQAAEAWQAGSTGTNSVYVGVIDEGIQVAHPELAPNIWNNPFDPADGLDNDGNGYADDSHGWNFYDYNNSVFDGTGDSHGTHVAGTIGAKGGNGAGVAGMAWNVSIISGKFLGAQGGTTADAIEAIDYFVDLKTRHKINLVALNNSWGGGGYSQALHDAVLRAAKAGILFVAAAGNGDANGNGLNNDSMPHYPSNYDTRVGTSTEAAASYDAVIAVAAIDDNGGRATFSNYGAKNVDLGAPGVSILSTLPTDSYGYSDGTSMATPHVTGAVALYASTHPGESAAQIKSAILGSAKPTPSLAGVTATGGRLDLSTIIGVANQAPTPVKPAAPTGVAATAGKAQVNGNSAVTLKWNASAGATNYTVKRGTSATGPFTVVSTGVTGTNYSQTVGANGATYYYVVSAANAAGESTNSAVASVRPIGPAPTNLKATAASRSQIKLSWVDQSSDETGFKIDYSLDGYRWYYLGAVGSNVTTPTVSGLSANRTYYFRVRAYNGSVHTTYSNSAGARTLY